MEQSKSIDLKKHELIPDVLPSVSGNVELMKISYGDTNVTEGLELTPGQTHEQPRVSWSNDAKKFYTLFMTDPDAPSRAEPSFREFIHWVVTDIPGDDVANGVVILDYLGPGPPHASGVHRYSFFVYEQKEKGVVKVDETKKNIKQRGGKKISDVVEEAELGDPISGGLFVSKWTEDVDAYHKAMGWMPPEKYRSPAQQEESKEEKKEESKEELTVGYWDIRGLAAPLRMICEFAEVKYNDVKYEIIKKNEKWSCDSWFKNDKPNILKKNPLANLPYIVDGKTVVTQSNACLKYLGRKLNLYGKDDCQALKVDQCLCEIMDLRNAMIKVFYGDSKTYATDADNLISIGAPKSLQKMENWLAHNKTLFCASDSPTVADFHLWELIDQMEMLAKKRSKPSLLEKKPNLEQFYSKFRNLEKLSDYFEGELYKLPINNKMANFK